MLTDLDHVFPVQPAPLTLPRCLGCATVTLTPPLCAACWAVAPSPVTRLRRTLWQWTWTGLGFVGAFTLVVRLGAMLGVW